MKTHILSLCLIHFHFQLNITEKNPLVRFHTGPIIFLDIFSRKCIITINLWWITYYIYKQFQDDLTFISCHLYYFRILSISTKIIKNKPTKKLFTLMKVHTFNIQFEQKVLKNCLFFSFSEYFLQVLMNVSHCMDKSFYLLLNVVRDK